MTKTTCPICESPCTWNRTEFCIKVSCLFKGHFKALPQPDLTKLREIIKEHGDHAGPHMRSMAYPLIVQAVKELLEENKP